MNKGNILVENLLKTISNLGVSSLSKGCNIVAFSGGVDSSLVAALVHRIHPSNSWACIGTSAALPEDQLQLAKKVAEHIGIALKEVHTTEGDDPNYIANEGASCFHCKTHLYSALRSVASYAATQSSSSKNDSSTVVLFNGTNKDDLKDSTRVGLKAAENFNVASPLIGITKEEVRLAAKTLGLPNWNIAASPCLRSRLAFGVHATPINLKKVEEAEKIVRANLFLQEHHNLRVRQLSQMNAVVEVDSAILEEAALVFPTVQEQLSALGFNEIKLKQFKSGSLSGFALKK